MDDGNSFLNNYNKGRESGSSEAPKSGGGEKPGLRFEEKSGFVKPKKSGVRPPSPPKSSKLMGPIIAGGAVIVVAVIVMIVLLSSGVKVIDLKGWSITDARLWADENGVMLQEEEEYNDEYPENTVMYQDVEPGSKVKKGDFIKIKVSLGHDLSVTLPLPDLMNMTVEEVEAWSKQNFMTKVRVTSEFSDTVPKGRVIRYEINDSTVVDEVRRDTPIYVIVSKGAEDESSIQVEVPDFRTMTLGDCYAFANENGIVLTVTEQYDEYVPKGSIISQSEKAKARVSKGSEIKLVVSKGKKITMPDFSKYSKDMAASVASQLGITCIQTEWYSGAAAGKFLSQSIKADTVYEDGEVLELKYSKGNKVNVPLFDTQGAIEEWANGLNQEGASIKINVTTVMSSQPKGNITYQDKVNVLIPYNDTIQITVSAGSLIYAPDFVGTPIRLGKGYEDAVTRVMAIEMCESLRLIPNFVEEYNGDYLPGEVWYQSVPAGAEITEGTVITLKYNPNNQWTDVPNFVSENVEENFRESDWYKENIKKLKIVIEGDGTKVKAQSIPENTRVAYGTKVVLTIEATSSSSGSGD